MKQTDIIQQTRCWLEKVIIGLNFCPFAQREFINERIHYAVSEAVNMEEALESLASELLSLDQEPAIETTLLMFAASFSHFEDFLDLIEFSNDLIDTLGYRGTYQLAHFHPDYCFDGVESDDASNFTNRSPWPTLHLIREASLQAAIEAHGHTEAIPEANIRLARKLGFDKMRQLLKQCQ